MTLLLELVFAWIVLVPLLALGCGAFMRAGRGPGLPWTSHERLTLAA